MPSSPNMEAPSSEQSTAAHTPRHSGDTLIPLHPTVSLHRTISRGHDPNAADLSYPFRAEAGLTSEYRDTTETGLIRGDTAFRRIRDPEKAKHLADLKLVTFVPNDPEDPRNFSRFFKWYITAVCALSVVEVAFASSVVTGDFNGLEAEFHMGEVVIALSVSLMVCGFGVGPLLWSPLCEIVGRRSIWIFPTIVYIIFIIPCALAKNIQTLLICRFLCGFFASAPLTLAGGTISDIWDNEERGFAIALFAAAPYGGPVLGPIVGGFIGETVGWRWIFWVNMIYAGVMLFFKASIPETFAPTILKRRAARLRKETGDETICTEQEVYKVAFSDMLMDTLIRPFAMLVTEPILLLLSLYIALIYGLLYAFFFSFPVVFGDDYHWNNGLVGLTFISVWIGLALALAVMPLLQRDYMKRADAKGGKAEPEDRLVGMMVGSIWVPISLFIFGWTSPPAVMPGGGNWVGPVSSGIPFGFGMVVIYFSANAYIIDAFPGYVASALAAKTVIRSGSGAAMPLFITAMFHNLGNGWAASTWAFISLAMCPIPFLFYRYGKTIRSKSKRATSA
ncbi:hypothetical protein PHLGIDRAFT_21131 [Phlebiopsis gigantea 11061_1 CR5-6]|uniref:Major facilitator superfamily (MFS) profile domain-containing protein n=1 Tax=Phlebiopsis gigantea (strain 11061_1 CR5-6) TaxID=745531 RepID=A0A0C3SFM4_PHLG1|nr:hypothetical protein PHLGIDRAFT_21131 [Phlebiopsis gigantea 11061_1 CR5-6]